MSAGQRLSNPPDAASLMLTARSFGNYDLAGALADLIDNCIVAKSTQIDIQCDYDTEKQCEIRIRDNGLGMNRDTLHAAMRPASTNPDNERSTDDLGRFGWGMKSASFSQCKILTVISIQDGTANAARWDLDDIDGWSMTVYDHDDATALLEVPFKGANGTELVWSNCDRLSENGRLTEDQFSLLVVSAIKKLSLIFHRYLSGDNGKFKALKISVNGTALDQIDPFCTSNIATTVFPPELITVTENGQAEGINMQAYTLPHYSKLTANEYEDYGGAEGYIRNQGFYVYRNRRLIIWGTWFGLAKHGDLSKLVRIRIDIPNTLDDMWKITVDKSDAQLPAVLKKRMKALVDRFRKSSSRVFRSKGANIGNKDRDQVWNKMARSQRIKYLINRKHPLTQTLKAELSKDGKALFKQLLDMIENDIPLDAISSDIGANPHNVHQRDVSREAFHEFTEQTVPMIMARYKNFDTFETELKRTEPYASNWNVVEDFLKDIRPK